MEAVEFEVERDGVVVRISIPEEGALPESRVAARASRSLSWLTSIDGLSLFGEEPLGTLWRGEIFGEHVVHSRGRGGVRSGGAGLLK